MASDILLLVMPFVLAIALIAANQYATAWLFEIIHPVVCRLADILRRLVCSRTS